MTHQMSRRPDQSSRRRYRLVGSRLSPQTRRRAWDRAGTVLNNCQFRNHEGFIDHSVGILTRGVPPIVTRGRDLVANNVLVQADQLPLEFLFQCRLLSQQIQCFNLLVPCHNRDNFFHACHHGRVLFRVIGHHLLPYQHCRRHREQEGRIRPASEHRNRPRGVQRGQDRGWQRHCQRP